MVTSPLEPPKANILIVDDTLPNLRLLRTMLEHHKYHVTEAADGPGALASVQKQRPDMVLLDIRMPGMDGYEVCQRLKADENTRQVPIIFISALDEQLDKVQGFAVGGVDYITKPFHVKEVLARVETHLTLRNLQRQLETQNTQLQQEIEERIRAELALQAANEELEHRVQMRTADLVKANETLNIELQERQRAEAERELLWLQVRDQAQQVQEIINTVPEGMLLLNYDGRVMLANPTASRALQLLCVPQAGDIITHLGNRPLVELLTSPPPGTWHEVKSGGRIFEVIARPIISSKIPSQRWVMAIRDVTFEREAQHQAQQQERLAAVGQLAAGIAHDFNNILAVIILYADMALGMPELQPKLRERLQTITQQARRASDLIQQILDFSRKLVLERRHMDLLPFLKEQVKLFERTLPENIKIEMNYLPGEYLVEVDPTRMQQTIMNTVVNSRDAMPEGGNLKISLYRTQPGDAIHCCTCGEIATGEWICITIADSGVGIPAEDLPHIFEPFFTTKLPGQGTGLGLSQVYGIIKKHEGHIDVQSTLGEGTYISLYLPVPQEERPQTQDSDIRVYQRGQGQIILVVEDEPATRQALMDGLSLLNYHILPATDGVGALEFLRQGRNHVDLVLSDVVMPEMGGVALFRAIRKMGLSIPVILMTGHPLHQELEDLKAEGLNGWLVKPPRLKQLSQIIAQVLE
jgi:two-component system cell cycle sensor histidine kinase/response regulator CckA